MQTKAWRHPFPAPSTAGGANFDVVDAKGDLIVGTADNTVGRRAVGTNNHVLVADSAETTGVKWASVAVALLDLRGATAATDIMSMGVTGDTFNRFVLDADGTMWIGTGAAAAQRTLSAGVGSTTLGRNAGSAIVAPANMTALGVSAGELATTGDRTTAVGYQALQNNVTSHDNTAVGFTALRSATAGHNTAVGSQTLTSLSSGQYNTAVGSQALLFNSTGSHNVAVGRTALYSGTGSYCVAVGSEALQAPANVGANATTSGERQTAVGFQTGQNSTTPRNDTVAVGFQAIFGANDTVALGSGANAAHANGVALGKGIFTTAINQVAIGPNHIEMTEMTEPAAGAANSARLYSKDNGAGKTQLCVRFATGAVQVLATEP